MGLHHDDCGLRVRESPELGPDRRKGFLTGIDPLRHDHWYPQAQGCQKGRHVSPMDERDDGIRPLRLERTPQLDNPTNVRHEAPGATWLGPSGAQLDSVNLPIERKEIFLADIREKRNFIALMNPSISHPCQHTLGSSGTQRVDHQADPHGLRARRNKWSASLLTPS